MCTSTTDLVFASRYEKCSLFDTQKLCNHFTPWNCKPIAKEHFLKESITASITSSQQWDDHSSRTWTRECFSHSMLTAVAFKLYVEKQPWCTTQSPLTPVATSNIWDLFIIHNGHPSGSEVKCQPTNLRSECLSFSRSPVTSQACWLWRRRHVIKISAARWKTPKRSKD